MLALADQSKPIDYLTVGGLLEERGELASVDGYAGLAGLTDGFPQWAGIDGHVELVQKASAQRGLIISAVNLIEDVYAGRPIEEIRGEIIASAEQARVSSPSLARDTSAEKVKVEYIRYAKDMARERIRLDFGEFDDYSGGLGKGEVLTILARTGVGKTAVLLNIVSHLAQIREDFGSVIFSLEMPRIGIMERLIQIHTGQNRRAVQALAREDFHGSALMDRFDEIYGQKIHIYDRTSTLEDMARFVRAVRDCGRRVDVIGIDYLGLIETNKRYQNEREKVGGLAKRVKRLARELEVGAILLCQTGRSGAGGQKDDGSIRPTKESARDSGEIEDAADYIMGAWRPELAHEHSVDGAPPHDVNRMGFAVLKVRNGPTGDFWMHFDKPCMRITPINFSEELGFND